MIETKIAQPLSPSLINKRSLHFILLGFISFNFLLAGLYLSPISSFLTKDFWEAFSLSCHGAATVICWFKYSQSRSSFLLWCSICISALLFRDWHYFVWEGHPTLTSIGYYTILVLAFGSGLFKIEQIKQGLLQNKALLLLWGTTFLFYFFSYIYDREMLKYILSGSIISYEAYLEEASEATGSLLLLIAAFICKSK